jgi:hypothetical protein
MTVYYRDDSVHVNSRSIQVGDQVYPLAALDDVWLERGQWQPDRLLGVLLLRLLVVAAGVTLVAAVIAVVLDVRHPAGSALPAWAVYGYLFASPVVLAVLIRLAERTHGGGTRVLSLCARCEHTTLTLYSTTNATRFGQIHRAVRRALEHGG